jgi:hypothetical protein
MINVGAKEFAIKYALEKSNLIRKKGQIKGNIINWKEQFGI